MARLRETQRWKKAIEKAKDKITKIVEEKTTKLKEDLDEEARSAISAWYAKYNPTYYGMMRQMRLRQAYRIEQDGIEVSISFDSSYLSGLGFHQSEETIYNYVFVLGYHGGSPGTDKNGVKVDDPHWRTPYPSKVNKLKGLTPYSKWSEREVVKTEPSPYDAIKEKSKEIMADFENDFVDELQNKVMKPLWRSYGGLTRR